MERGVLLTRGDPGLTPGAAVRASVSAARAALGAESQPVDAHIGLQLGPVDLGRIAGGLRLGDSHGLAVAVAVLRNEGAAYPGPAVVAATGRVTGDGSVRPVGGLGPKVRAARRAGATVLLVPTDQADAAAELAGSEVTVIGIAHLRDVLRLATDDRSDAAAVGRATEVRTETPTGGAGAPDRTRGTGD